MKTFSKNKIIIGIALFSAVLTLLVYIFIFPEILPCRFRVLNQTQYQSIPDQCTSIDYYDFDKNGSQEIIRAYSTEAEGVDFIKVYRADGSLIDQYNFTGRFPATYRFFFYDNNKDGIDELLAFHIAKDSTLLLSAVNVFSHSFLFKDVLVMNKPADAETGIVWDLVIVNCLFADFNDDKNDEFIFSIRAGYSLSPRGIFVFDFSQKKLINEFFFHFHPGTLYYRDLTGDGIPELFFDNRSSGNFTKETPFHDASSWFVVLDKQLSIQNTPVELGGYTSSVNHFSFNRENYIFLSANDTLAASEGIVYRIKQDLSLEEVKRFPGAKSFIPFDTKDGKVECTAIYKNGTIERFDQAFNSLSKPENNASVDFFRTVFSTPGTGDFEFYTFKGSTITLLDGNFQNAGQLDLKDDTIEEAEVPINGEENKPIFSVNGKKYHYLLEVESNPYYSYRFLFILLAAAGFFGILYALFSALIYLLVFFSFFIHSFRKSNTGLVIINYEGKIIYSNKQAVKILFLSTPIRKWKPFTEALCERAEVCEVISSAVTLRESKTESVHYSSPQFQMNGTVTVTPFTFLNFIAAAYLVEIENYSEVIILERTRIWAKSILKIAHEIKTPLSSVSMVIQTIENSMKSKFPDENEMIEDIAAASAEVNRVRNLTKNFLKFINMEVLNVQAVSLESILSETIEKFKEYIHNGLVIEKYLDPNADILWADSFQLSQVFQILIENAIDAMPQRGRIVIASQALPFSDGGKIVEVQFSDNGSGIKDEIKDKLFSPYLTTKKEGTGIGLFIAKKIIDDHKGEIRFTTETGKGTTFYLTLKGISAEELQSVR